MGNRFQGSRFTPALGNLTGLMVQALMLVTSITIRNSEMENEFVITYESKINGVRFPEINITEFFCDIPDVNEITLESDGNIIKAVCKFNSLSEDNDDLDVSGNIYWNYEEKLRKALERVAEKLTFKYCFAVKEFQCKHFRKKKMVAMPKLL